MYDPFSPNTILELEQFDEFKFGHANKEKIVAYIILMHDTQSDLKKLYPDDYYRRKREAALQAGFILNSNGEFDKDTEDILLGNNNAVNDAILKYARLSGIPDAQAYIFYQELLTSQIREGMNTQDPKILKDIRANIHDSMDQIEALEVKIFGGREVENVRAALYRLAERQLLQLRPEAMAQAIENKTVAVPDPYYPKKKAGRPRKHE